VTCININLGSGQRPFKNWVNVDLNPKWSPDVVAEGANYLYQLESDSVDKITLHHVLEHYGCGEAARLLAQCYRTLKPLGSLFVFVPDMRELAQMWFEGRLDDATYLINVYGAYMQDEADRHKFGFTRRSLFNELQGHGFRVRMFDWREVEGADFARARWVLAVEAIKP